MSNYTTFDSTMNSVQPSVFPPKVYLFQGQNDRVEEINTRLLERFDTPIGLAPNFSPRPTPTKYSRFPMLDLRTQAVVPIKATMAFQPSLQFNPSGRGPVSGFNVETETDLRNQRFALQTQLAQNTYIPSTNSDLYKTTIISRPKQTNGYSYDPHPLARKTYDGTFDQTPHPNIANFPEIGRDMFFNDTRAQLRSLTQ
jgi:hypothetical protein